jgi:hypothetical protein
MVVYPKVLGDSIDHLIAKDYSYMWYLIITFVAIMAFGYASRIYDTKVFSGIYRRFYKYKTQNNNLIEPNGCKYIVVLMQYICCYKYVKQKLYKYDNNISNNRNDCVYHSIGLD